eukprot:jgi/Chlat1/3000/Chrsp2S04710
MVQELLPRLSFAALNAADHHHDGEDTLSQRQFQSERASWLSSPSEPTAESQLQAAAQTARPAGLQQRRTSIESHFRKALALVHSASAFQNSPGAELRRLCKDNLELYAELSYLQKTSRPGDPFVAKVAELEALNVQLRKKLSEAHVLVGSRERELVDLNDRSQTLPTEGESATEKATQSSKADNAADLGRLQELYPREESLLVEQDVVMHKRMLYRLTEYKAKAVASMQRLQSHVSSITTRIAGAEGSIRQCEQVELNTQNAMVALRQHITELKDAKQRMAETGQHQALVLKELEDYNLQREQQRGELRCQSPSLNALQHRQLHQTKRIVVTTLRTEADKAKRAAVGPVNGTDEMKQQLAMVALLAQLQSISLMGMMGADFLNGRAPLIQTEQRLAEAEGSAESVRQQLARTLLRVSEVQFCLEAIRHRVDLLPLPPKPKPEVVQPLLSPSMLAKLPHAKEREKLLAAAKEAEEPSPPKEPVIESMEHVQDVLSRVMDMLQDKEVVRRPSPVREPHSKVAESHSKLALLVPPRTPDPVTSPVSPYNCRVRDSKSAETTTADVDDEDVATFALRSPAFQRYIQIAGSHARAKQEKSLRTPDFRRHRPSSKQHSPSSSSAAKRSTILGITTSPGRARYNKQPSGLHDRSVSLMWTQRGSTSYEAFGPSGPRTPVGRGGSVVVGVKGVKQTPEFHLLSGSGPAD